MAFLPETAVLQLTDCESPAGQCKSRDIAADTPLRGHHAATASLIKGLLGQAN
jgi:hypothetical protein